MSTILATPISDTDLTEARLAAQAHALGEVARIMALEDEYDDEFLRPTPKVTELTCRLLTDAAILMAQPLPRADIGPMGDGGIGIQWGGDAAHVRLLVPHDTSKSYVYAYSSSAQRVGDATGKVLAADLDWLLTQ